MTAFASLQVWAGLPGAMQESRDQWPPLGNSSCFCRPSYSLYTTNTTTMSDEPPEIDAHKVSVEELCKRFKSNIEEGLTKEQVAEGQKEHGPNAIRSPPQVPIWVRLCCFCFCLEEIKKNGFSYGPEYQKNPAKTARVRRNGSTVEIPAEDLTLGDIVELKAGDMVPADIRIIKADGFEVIIINTVIIIIIIITIIISIADLINQQGGPVLPDWVIRTGF